MAELDFPTSPSDGDTYAGYIYDSAKGVWQWQVSTTLDQGKAGLLTAGSDTISVDFSTSTPLISRNVGGTAVVLSGSNYEAGVTRTVRIVGGTAVASLSVPSGWVFVGSSAGTSIGTATTMIVTATAFGTAEADVVAAFAEAQ